MVRHVMKLLLCWEWTIVVATITLSSSSIVYGLSSHHIITIPPRIATTQGITQIPQRRMIYHSHDQRQQQKQQRQRYFDNNISSISSSPSSSLSSLLSCIESQSSISFSRFMKMMVMLLFVIATTMSPLSSSPSLAYATIQQQTTTTPFIYTNDYSDPLHPICERHIVVNPDGKTFHYTGTAVGPKNDPVLRGCTPKEIELYTLRYGAFDGMILPTTKTTTTMGTSYKISAGDGIHEGIWEPALTVDPSIPYYDVDGIRWNDGNKWIVLSPSSTPSKQ
jgi:hypothetical protein